MTRVPGRAAHEAVPLDPRMVLGAYSVGAFPMADARTARSIYWVEPRERAILPLDGFHLSKSLRKTLTADRFRITADQAFPAIIQLCAEAAADRPDTWINGQIEQVYLELHAMGFAHSIEVWDGDRLVGGLYGLALGRAFFGESMVSRARDASKVAIAALVARLRVGGFTLLDCQFMTDHLATLGAIEISRRSYLTLLSGAVSDVTGAGATAAAGDFFALDRGVAAPSAPLAPPLTEFGPPSGKVIAQLLVHTS
ncbi:leucyl/phenylalanyl-tRNA--protein transferase [Sphingomonas hylomeconis]|uniref:Leucyl/phenylalanyl-tRNA--protein transferase n=1 Tax=Sphingomonas hylomeconis TaxID=1395958 RepID=A0ABV7T087_9SPHN|nr:leucyl/phenylalanyl-tRNA--protein transferase [Sphingomonas hylomeconis]